MFVHLFITSFNEKNKKKLIEPKNQYIKYLIFHELSMAL
jgi:hypothetical protein